MTGQMTYDAHASRLDDFHRHAAEHRRSHIHRSSLRRGGSRVTALFRLRAARGRGTTVTSTA